MKNIIIPFRANNTKSSVSIDEMLWGFVVRKFDDDEKYARKQIAHIAKHCAELEGGNIKPNDAVKMACYEWVVRPSLKKRKEEQKELF